MLGLGLSIPQLATRGGRTLTLSQQVAALFANGAQGAWYDPSDLTTLFEDAAGTIPITTPLEKPVGLMLDKSKGLVLGPELVTNSQFQAGITGWTNATFGSLSWNSTDQRLRLITAGGTFGRGYTTISTTPGKWYEVRSDVWKISGAGYGLISANTDATANVSLGSSILQNGAAQQYFRFLAQGSTTFIFVLSTVSGDVSEFDNISVREILGNHAYQSTTTSRPTLSARVNLLTKTEQFDAAAWTKSGMLAFGSGSVANATNAPDGTVTADLLVPNTTASVEHYADVGAVSSIAITSGTSYTISWCGKAAGYKWLRLAFNASIAPGSERAAWFDVEAGVKGTVQPNVTAKIEPLPNGFYRCTITRTATASATPPQVGYASITNANDGTSFTANGTSGMYWWGADLRVANDGVGLPAYQRVNTATDYDYAGFPPYLKFDGTDDGMATGNIDFTGTDKMFVAAGVRKLSDAAGAFVVEHSVNSTTENGTFGLFAPRATNTPYSWRSRGTSGSDLDITSGYAAPITNVLTGIGNISGDSTILRINGTQAGSSTADQGTGNYGNYPLYIGRRGGTTLPFNGRIYSLVVVGKLASAAEITATEALVNGKTKAF